MFQGPVLDPFIKFENEHLLAITEDKDYTDDDNEGDNDDDAHARSLLLENVLTKNRFAKPV